MKFDNYSMLMAFQQVIMLCDGDGQLKVDYFVGCMNKDLLNGNGIDGFERYVC